MESTTLICPSCKSTCFELDEKCEICNFPLKGNEKEKAVFIGQKYAKKQKADDGVKAINKNRNLLFAIGGFNIVISPILFLMNRIQIGDGILNLIVGLIFIGLGLLAKIQPLVSFILALLLLLGLYLLNYLVDPSTIFNGIILKLIIIGSLIYAIVRAMEK